MAAGAAWDMPGMLDSPHPFFDGARSIVSPVTPPLMADDSPHTQRLKPWEGRDLTASAGANGHGSALHLPTTIVPCSIRAGRQRKNVLPEPDEPINDLPGSALPTGQGFHFCGDHELNGRFGRGSWFGGTAGGPVAHQPPSLKPGRHRLRARSKYHLRPSAAIRDQDRTQFSFAFSPRGVHHHWSLKGSQRHTRFRHRC